MKNLALTIIAVAGISAASFGQTEKPKLDKTPQHMKTEKSVPKKKALPPAKKKDAPAKNLKTN